MKEHYIIAHENEIGQRLDHFLNEKLSEFEFSKSYIQTLIQDGSVTVNGAQVKNGYRLKSGMEINVEIEEEKELEILPEDIPLSILYQDSDLLVIDKPAGLMVHPAPNIASNTLVNAILFHVKDLSSINGVIRPGIVHRLDKETSGLIIIAKNNASHLALMKQFQEHTIEKTYIAICKGYLKKQEGSLYTKMGRDPKDRKKMAVTALGKEAITHYAVLDQRHNMSLIKVKIDTGRTHQIRVHMRYLNVPVLGDSVYGRAHDRFERQLLHAHHLSFIHPTTNEKMEFTAPLPTDFKEAIRHYQFQTDYFNNEELK